MRNRFKVHYFIIIGLAVILLIPLLSCAALQSLFQNQHYIYEEGAVLVGGDNRPIELINNPEAVNVSYAYLLEFISEDPTDQHPYVARGNGGGLTPYVCSDFAEAVHNNAEKYGVKAGYMGIDFADGGIGHAVDVFETTDMGTVYIDCTGSSIYSQLEEGRKAATTVSWDKVGYIQIGKKYGVIGLDHAISTDYLFFEQFDQMWQNYKDKLAAYNAEVKQYNQEIANNVYRQGSPELKRIRSWELQLKDKEKDLDVLNAEIGDSRFKPLGIVKSTFVHW